MKVFGLIGEKLEHSFSPKLHKEILETSNILGLYNLFSVDKKFEDNIVESLKVLGINGANVTIPYKEVVLNQLDFISEEAKIIGAVNTILIKEDKSYGYNTDYYGFGKMLNKENIKVLGNSFFVLGSGGAARSVVKYLEDNGAKEIVLVSRNKENAKNKFKDFKISFMDYKDLENVLDEFAIINTTPCGMYPKIDSIAISPKLIGNFKVAIDIVYNPLETKFLKIAREKGLKTVNGLMMLVGQGIKSEEIWNNLKINKDLEDKIYEKLKKEF